MAGRALEGGAGLLQAAHFCGEPTTSVTLPWASPARPARQGGGVPRAAQGPARKSRNMPLKLMGKALFKVRAGPMGVEHTCWDGPLSEFVMFLGLGYRGESNFLVCLLLKVN